MVPITKREKYQPQIRIGPFLLEELVVNLASLFPTVTCGLGVIGGGVGAGDDGGRCVVGVAKADSLL